MDKTIRVIKKLDAYGVLTPYLEVNFAEFNSCQAGFLSDTWVT